MDKIAIQQHLEREASPFVLRRAASGPRWDDEAVHQEAHDADPQLYALRALSPGIQTSQRVRVLYQLLRSPRNSMRAESTAMADRVISVLLSTSPADEVIKVFLALRRARVNRKHATRVILLYILNHPRLADLAGRRRQAVVDCIEHAVGRDVARGCARMIGQAERDANYVVRNILRFAHDKDRAATIIEALYSKANLPAVVESARYDIYHQTFAPSAVRSVGKGDAPRPKTVTVTNRGDISATLVHLYRGGKVDMLSRALEAYVERAAAGLPKFDGSMAVVLDASASTRGYGEREFSCISQSVALRMVLQRCCPNIRIHQAGGSGEPPAAQGPTDLASPLLDLLAEQPDVVAIISDGYENTYAGDLGKVVASLARIGLDVSIVFCHSKFTEKDSLEYRRPAPLLPEVEFWHERDFEKVLYTVFSAARGDAGRRFLHGYLSQRLARREAEVESWVKRR